jgi:hypothetical protein
MSTDFWTWIPWKSTDISEECTASIFMAKGYVKQEPTYCLLVAGLLLGLLFAPGGGKGMLSSKMAVDWNCTTLLSL